MQTVKTKFGSKEKLVEKLSGKLKKREGESDSALKKRLLKVSSNKLLHLHVRIDPEKTK
ncbi:MAG: hypothetical protein V1495_02745 [Pseudomonadota bacterium]